ncbi:MAG: efflux RND transporter periplasmic adaptor subunit [Planctomycetota bacterium]
MSAELRARLAVSALLVAVFTALGVGAFMGLKEVVREPDKADRKPPRTVVRVVTVTRGEYRETLRGYGRARALRTADVSAEVSGVVASVADGLEAGAAVAAGDELVRIDPRDYETAKATAKARRDQAGAAVSALTTSRKNLQRRLDLAKKDLEAAERELERVRGLAEQEVVTQSDLDRQRITKSLTEKEVVGLESQLDQNDEDLVRARAEVAAADAALTRAETDVDRTTVRAPFPGRIVARRISKGTRVAPGTVLFTLVDLSRVEVPVALGASRYGEVAAGSNAAIRDPAGGEPRWTGTVARISPVVSDRDRTFSAFLVVEGTPLVNPVPPGTFVLAEVEGRRFADVIPVPRIAFVADRVYIAGGASSDGAVVTARTPEVLRMLPAVALVTGGLEPGDRVIVTNLEQIAEGAIVRVVGEDGAE